MCTFERANILAGTHRRGECRDEGELLHAMPPFLFGGHMIRHVGDQETTWADLPAKFEAGTAPMAEAVGLGAAVDYLQSVGLDAIEGNIDFALLHTERHAHVMLAGEGAKWFALQQGFPLEVPYTAESVKEFLDAHPDLKRKPDAKDKPPAPVHADGASDINVNEFNHDTVTVLALDQGTFKADTLHRRELAGKTMVIIGAGQVGSRVAKKALALGMNPLLNDPPIKDRTRDRSEEPHV